MRKSKTMKEIIKVHSLILLNFYGVKEKLIQKNPEALNSFIELLNEEFNQEIDKYNDWLLKKFNLTIGELPAFPPKNIDIKELIFTIGFEKILKERIEASFELGKLSEKVDKL